MGNLARMALPLCERLRADRWTDEADALDGLSFAPFRAFAGINLGMIKWRRRWIFFGRRQLRLTGWPPGFADAISAAREQVIGDQGEAGNGEA